jgi:hypothetical protein
MSTVALEFVPTAMSFYYIAPIDSDVFYGFSRHETEMTWAITSVSHLLAEIAHEHNCFQVLGRQFSSIDMLVNLVSVIISSRYPLHIDNNPLQSMYLSPIYHHCSDKLFVDDLHKIPGDPPGIPSAIMKTRLIDKGWVAHKDVHGDLLISAYSVCHIAELYRVYMAYLERLSRVVQQIAPIISVINPKL